MNKLKCYFIWKKSVETCWIPFRILGRYFLYDDDPCPRLNNHEIRKIDFSFVSEHCATLRTEKMKAALFEGGSLGIDR